MLIEFGRKGTKKNDREAVFAPLFLEKCVIILLIIT